MSFPRPKRACDHRLVRLVQETPDATIATDLGVPRSTVPGGLRRSSPDVVSAPGLDASSAERRARLARLERHVRRLPAFLPVPLDRVRVAPPDRKRLRVPQASPNSRLPRAIDRSPRVLGLRRVPGGIGLSPSRFSAWRRAAAACELDDPSSCPTLSPQQLTVEEVTEIRDIVTSAECRHVATGRFAILAPRIGRFLASPSTRYRPVRE